MRCERISLIFHSLAVHVMPFVCVCVCVRELRYTLTFLVGPTKATDRDGMIERAQRERSTRVNLSLSLCHILRASIFSATAAIANELDTTEFVRLRRTMNDKQTVFGMLFHTLPM